MGRINIFYAIYLYYILTCRTRKKLPMSTNFEIMLRYECKHIIITNPTNIDLTDNLLSLWTGREPTRMETLELLNEVEGSFDNGSLFKNSNKNLLFLKTRLHHNFGFPFLG